LRTATRIINNTTNTIAENRNRIAPIFQSPQFQKIQHLTDWLVYFYKRVWVAFGCHRVDEGKCANLVVFSVCLIWNTIVARGYSHFAVFN
jgi:hypothetical protein